MAGQSRGFAPATPPGGAAPLGPLAGHDALHPINLAYSYDHDVIGIDFQ
jgi:hypothetical protein